MFCSRCEIQTRKMRFVMRGLRGSRGRPDPTNDQTPTLTNFKMSSHLRAGVWSFVGSTAASNGRVGTGGRNEILYFWALGGIGGPGPLVTRGRRLGTLLWPTGFLCQHSYRSKKHSRSIVRKVGRNGMYPGPGYTNDSEMTFWVPEGNLSGFVVRHEMALEFVCGADF